MKPCIVKSFWISFAILLILTVLLYLWAKVDNSCGGAYICITTPVALLLYLIILSPVVLLIVSAVALTKDFRNPGLGEEIKISLRKAIWVCVGVFILGFLGRIIWYFNYHGIIVWNKLFFPSIIIVAYVSFVIGILDVQRRLHSLRKKDSHV